MLGNQYVYERPPNLHYLRFSVRRRDTIAARTLQNLRCEHPQEKKAIRLLFAMLMYLIVGSTPIRSSIGSVVDYVE